MFTLPKVKAKQSLIFSDAVKLQNGKFMNHPLWDSVHGQIQAKQS